LETREQIEKRWKEISSKRAKVWYIKNKKRILARVHSYRSQEHIRLWYKNRNCIITYGITMDEYLRLKKKAKGRCKLCKRKTQRLCLDHCHKTGRIRGFLCDPCNRSVIGVIEKRGISPEDIVKYLKG
jgi:hypothetical protein